MEAKSLGTLGGGALADNIATLQRRLAEESLSRDGAKSSLQHLRRTIEFYRERLCLVTSAGMADGGQEGGKDRLRQLLHSMAGEVQSVAFSSGVSLVGQSTNALQGCGVLWASLEEAQRRCERTNCDMVFQADANEELVEVLHSVKDANKRLLEQIRLQTNEIAQLTQQRVADEERVERLKQRHQRDHESARDEVRRQISGIKSAVAGQYGTQQEFAATRLSNVRVMLRTICQDSCHIEQIHQSLHDDAVACISAFQQQMGTASDAVVNACDTMVGHHSKQCQSLKMHIRDLEELLESEKDLRHREALAWGQQHSALLAERDCAHACMARDQSQLISQMQALERTNTLEQKSWDDERVKLELRCHEMLQLQTDKSREVDAVQRNIVRLESSVSAALSDVRAQERAVDEFRLQIRESDDALAAAVSGNEHLRKQMEEQRRRFEEKNTDELARCNSKCEEKLNNVCSEQDAGTSLATQQIWSMEQEEQEEHDAVQALQGHVDSICNECTFLVQDVDCWKQKLSNVQNMRQLSERDFAEARQRVSLQRIELQSEIGSMTSKVSSLEDEVQSLQARMDHHKDNAAARETCKVSRVSAAEVLLRSEQDEAADLKRRLLEASELRAKADVDASCSRQRALEIQMDLERKVESMRESVKADMTCLAGALMQEQKATEVARQDCMHEQETKLNIMRSVQEDSMSKLGSAEREKTRVEERCKQQLSDTNEMVAVQQRRVEALECDLVRVRGLLSESEGNLMRIRQKFDREDQEMARTLKQLSDDVCNTQWSFEKAVQEEANLSRYIEELVWKSKQDQQSFTPGMKDVSICVTSAPSDSGSRQQLGRQPRAAISSPQLSREWSEDKGRRQPLDKENVNAKSIGGGCTGASTGLSSLHSKLESHIQRLQRHTEDLKSSLQESAGAPAR